MPTTTPWSSWLRDALAEREWDQAELVRRSNGALNSGEVSRWLAGKVTPKIDSIRAVCTALGRPAVEGMIAAGHLEPADVGATLIRQTSRADGLSSLEMLDELRRREESKRTVTQGDQASEPTPLRRKGEQVSREGETWAARRPRRDEPPAPD